LFLIIERKKEEEEKEKVMNVGMDEGGGFVGQFIFCKKKKLKMGVGCVFFFLRLMIEMEGGEGR